MEKNGRNKNKKKLSIRLKLITIITAIISITLISMIVLATVFFKDDTSLRINKNNHTIVEIIGDKVLSDLYSIIEKARLMVSSLGNENLNVNEVLSGDNDILYIAEIEKVKSTVSVQQTVVNTKLLQLKGISEPRIQQLFGQKSAKLVSSLGNSDQVINVSPILQQPSLAIIKPLSVSSSNRISSYIIIIVAMDKFLKTVESHDVVKKFIVNNNGDLLAHYDISMSASGANMSGLEIVKKMQSSNSSNMQYNYFSNNVEYQGSFKKLEYAGIGIIATVNVADAFRSVDKIQKNNLLFTIIALTIAVMLVYFFAKTLTQPILTLVRATNEIEKGNYDINIKPTSRDEIGELTGSFVRMSKGLAEREKIKDAFGKFVNKEIADQILSGGIKLGGERKKATIFFSDIRSFTQMSENLQPEEVVEFLNVYMSEMVECVNETHGVVDKFIGDAIMAVWGTPVSYGNDTQNAIDAALLMRERLKVFNVGRGDEDRPVIQIGCGINSGEVLAGQIGSKDRMEYTVIGDAVNLASRIEALNKPFGTDILISEDCYKEVRGLYIFGKMDKILVKGKTKPQQIYAILGRKGDPDTPKTMKELRKMLGTKKQVSKSGSHLKEEKKYEIL